MKFDELFKCKINQFDVIYAVAHNTTPIHTLFMPCAILQFRTGCINLGDDIVIRNSIIEMAPTAIDIVYYKSTTNKINYLFSIFYQPFAINCCKNKIMLSENK